MIEISELDDDDIIEYDAVKSLTKHVIRAKLNKLRHLVIQRAIKPDYLENIYPDMVRYFNPQHVKYNQGIDWRISCYLEVMPGGVPCTNLNMELRQLFLPLLESCNILFTEWYRQQRGIGKTSDSVNIQVGRIMTFITRYTAAPGEQALLKHVDGAGKVDGSVVVALPMDPLQPFEGYGGGLTFWDGRKKNEICYDTRCGDIAFIDKAVWHQANPISKGIRWALVIFYQVTKIDN